MDGWTDEDHLCAAATNLLMAMWTEEHLPQMQDIPSRSHERVFPGAYGIEEPLTPDPNNGAKEEATKGREDICDCYDPADDGRCRGTREIDLCYCRGNREVCDFYPEIRTKAMTRRQTGGSVAE